jgi:hypothetical protein
MCGRFAARLKPCPFKTAQGGVAEGTVHQNDVFAVRLNLPQFKTVSVATGKRAFQIGFRRSGELCFF